MSTPALRGGSNHRPTGHHHSAIIWAGNVRARRKFFCCFIPLNPIDSMHWSNSMAKLPLFINVPFRMLERRIAQVTELGLGVELYAENNVIEELPDSEIKRVSRLLKDRGIPCTVHAPFMDLSPGGFDKRVRAITKDKLKRAVRMAQTINAKGIVCHPGYDKWRFGANEEGWLEASVDTWTDVIAEAGTSLPIILENVFEETPSSFLALFPRFKKEDLFFCFDTGHFNLFSTLPLEGWLMPLKDRIMEMHLHDNHGASDEHLPVGRGTFPFRELKPFLKQREDIIRTAEVHGEAYAMESIKSVRDFLS
jgi:sugar phosphate isomerase/epimerase